MCVICLCFIIGSIDFLWFALCSYDNSTRRLSDNHHSCSPSSLPCSANDCNLRADQPNPWKSIITTTIPFTIDPLTPAISMGPRAATEIGTTLIAHFLSVITKNKMSESEFAKYVESVNMGYQMRPVEEVNAMAATQSVWVIVLLVLWIVLFDQCISGL